LTVVVNVAHLLVALVVAQSLEVSRSTEPSVKVLDTFSYLSYKVNP